MDLPSKLTPLERIERRWVGQTATITTIYDIPSADMDQPPNHVVIPKRAERISIAFVNNDRFPIIVRPLGQVNIGFGWLLSKWGDQLWSNVDADGELCIDQWLAQGTSFASTEITVIEQIRDTGLGIAGGT